MGLTLTLETQYSENEWTQVHWQNITHNLVQMADAADIYEAIWRPYRFSVDYDFNTVDEEAEDFDEEVYEVFASDILPKLKDGYNRLLNDREYYIKHEPSNKWGTYDNFLNFIEKYILACEAYPLARIQTYR